MHPAREGQETAVVTVVSLSSTSEVERRLGPHRNRGGRLGSFAIGAVWRHFEAVPGGSTYRARLSPWSSPPVRIGTLLHRSLQLLRWLCLMPSGLLGSLPLAPSFRFFLCLSPLPLGHDGLGHAEYSLLALQMT
jgi:hypothetical protein